MIENSDSTTGRQWPAGGMLENAGENAADASNLSFHCMRKVNVYDQERIRREQKMGNKKVSPHARSALLFW